MHPAITIVIPTFRRDELLKRCLTALLEQSLDPQQYEVIVVDDAASEITQRTVEQVGQWATCAVRYVAVTRVHGPAAARNAGWRAAQAPYIAFTDDDCVPDRSWLAEGLKCLQQGAHAVSGRIVMPLPPHPTDYELDAAGLASAEFATANCFVRREVLEAVGGFDEQFRIAWREDSDLQFTLLERGFSIINAREAVVVHPIRPGSWGIALKLHRKTLYDALLFKKHRKLYRERIAPMPWRYYAIVATALVTGILSFFGDARLIAMPMLAWVVLTGEFCVSRLSHSSRAVLHIAEIVYTSLLIPFLSVYWRIRGAFRYRVWFP